MTIHEAIRILDPFTTGQALNAIEYYAGFSGKQAKIMAVNDACDIAVKYLKKVVEKGGDDNDEGNLQY